MSFISSNLVDLFVSAADARSMEYTLGIEHARSIIVDAIFF